MVIGSGCRDEHIMMSVKSKREINFQCSIEITMYFIGCPIEFFAFHQHLT